MILPCEIYHSTEKKLTFLMMRSGPCAGKMRLFCDELCKFVKSAGFSNVVVLTATMSPVKRERESNR